MDSESSIEQVPFGSVDFAENPEPRCPCVLLLDTSGSMQGSPIKALNEGLINFRDQLLADKLATKRVEVSIITFGPVTTVAEFQTADVFIPPHLEAGSDTPMGAAIMCATEAVEARKALYRTSGIAYYRPWIFMITDGAPTDSWHSAAQKIREGEDKKSFSFYAVGTEDANFDILRQISVKAPLQLKGLDFRSLFQWLSQSMRSVSASTPGEAVPLQNPTAPDGWATTA